MIARAEVDVFMENGDCAVAVEIKTRLKMEYVDAHLKRIEIVRQYMDERGDKRKLFGAVAGGSVPEKVVKSAREQGLYVILQNGESVSIADAPQGFKAREWQALNKICVSAPSGLCLALCPAAGSALAAPTLHRRLLTLSACGAN